ncbi:cytochrome P450 [Dendrothele bispora CBS 962.96]|uniref:Cytochrome P450 n=1 Tax=Dendrothele bispora (strain CBS 962.96) TaxID=1314807 RepID=A0A4V4HG00_DENBC|nr:cytochrome P450 [Dendrothele bispora CBS 962.96]
MHLHDLHRNYGPVVRIGPNELHFSTAEAYKDIYHHGSKFLKDEGFYEMFGESLGSFGTVDPVFHRTRRDTMNPLFSRRAILKFESSIRARANQLMQVLSSKQGQLIDLSSAFRAMTLDVIYDYIYGEDAGAISCPDFEHPIISNTEAVNVGAGVQRHMSIVVRQSSLPDFIRRRIVMSIFPDLIKVIETRAIEFFERKAKVQLADEGETILSRIVDIENPFLQSLIEETQTLTFAGTDTVANACFTGCFYVHSDPEILKKVRGELKEAWPDPNMDLPYDTLEKLPYLTAVIKESLRLSHGVPVGLLRVVGPDSAVVGGYQVPQGTIVSVGATFMHWNPQVFPEPFKFNPDRWLQEQTRELDTYLVPFSRGPRQCIGMNLAWCELFLILGHLFRKLDIEIKDLTIQDMQDIRFYFVSVLAGAKHLRGIVKGALA